MCVHDSNGYQRSVFLSGNKKNISRKISTSVNNIFTIKWGVRGSKSHGRAIMIQSFTQFLAFIGVVVVFVCVCARQKQELAIEKKMIGL